MNNTYNYLVYQENLNTIITSTLLIILRLLQKFEIKILIIGYKFQLWIWNLITIIKNIYIFFKGGFYALKLHKIIFYLQN